MINKNKTDIIVCSGSSTSGKTTLVQQFLKAHPEYSLIQRDQLKHSKYNGLMKDNFPKEYAFLANHLGDDMYPYIDRKIEDPFVRNIVKYLSQDEVEEFKKAMGILSEYVSEHKEEITRELRSALKQKIINIIACGGKIILDSISYEPILEQLDDVNYLRIMVYCPFFEILPRLFKRNQKAVKDKNPKNQRNYQFAQYQYVSMYRSKIDNDETEIFETLNKKEFINELKKGIEYNEMEGISFPCNVFKDVETYISQVVSDIGFESCDHINIVSRNPDFDFSIYTTTLNASEKLINYIEQN